MFYARSLLVCMSRSIPKSWRSPKILEYLGLFGPPVNGYIQQFLIGNRRDLNAVALPSGVILDDYPGDYFWYEAINIHTLFCS